eukprot:TRINITY_DN27466_c1_g1_i1.p1 TRINITY_DN27466_c1_g1~~TRINITY_DN27466_c1_g1_i1.p1  ORF type:complete len:161 (-),score=29.63 TRINITY_DN27466_c1_g1_i1:171-653(-)
MAAAVPASGTPAPAGRVTEKATRAAALAGLERRGLLGLHGQQVEEAIFRASMNAGDNDARASEGGALECNRSSDYQVKFRALCSNLREKPGLVWMVTSGRLTAEALLAMPSNAQEAATRRQAYKPTRRTPAKILKSKGVKRHREEEEGAPDFRDLAQSQR